MSYVYRPRLKNPYSPLSDLMAVYERNYAWLQKLFPYNETRQMYHLHIGDKIKSEIYCEHLPLGPFTSELLLQQEVDASPWLSLPRVKVRLFHDAKMAEVKDYNKKEVQRLIYHQPNPKFQRYEKEAINRFLGEWLYNCQESGYQLTEIFVEND